MATTDALAQEKRARLAVHDAVTPLLLEDGVQPGYVATALADQLAWVIAAYVKEGKGPAQVEQVCGMIRDRFAIYAVEPDLRPTDRGSALPT